MADEFGDFQTPQELATDVCQFLARRGISPATVLEPTCGVGNFLLAALDRFPACDCLGVEINESYLEALKTSLRLRGSADRVRTIHHSFFTLDWPKTVLDLPEPLLVLGNPPWVTNSQLGTLGSKNLPAKSNFQGRVGLDALTGKSNFDISEWMLIQLLELLRGRRAWLGVLCKNAVARKVLAHSWKYGIPFDWAEMRGFDAGKFFGAAVDACLLVCSLSQTGGSKVCAVYPDFDADVPSGVIGYLEGHLVADVGAYERRRHMVGQSLYQWRSGVKHDCSKVMELRRESNGFRNGLGELVQLERDYVFPMLKSSELAGGRVAAPVRWMIVPQQRIGGDTKEIQYLAPNTWRYLVKHGEALDRRGSSIYRNKPRFSVFGVGDYTFSPWKVAISGFYKKLTFSVVGSSGEKPIVLDDTGYFLPCQSGEETRYIASLLNSPIAQDFFSAFIFWDAKRPITVDLLRRLDLRVLAQEAGSVDVFDSFSPRPPKAGRQPLGLFDC